MFVGLLALGAPSASAAVRVGSIRLTPGSQTLPPSRTVQYTASASMTDGTVQDVTANALWETADTALARFDTDTPGALRTRRPGVVEISATLLGRKGVATITIDPGEVVRLITRPSTKKLERNRPASFEARLVFETGYQQDVTAEARWSSTDPDVARVSNGATAGRVVPKTLGTTFIRARHPATGLANTDGATQVLRPIKKVRFEEASLVLGRGMTTDLRVVGYHGHTDVRSRLDDDLTFTTSDGSVIDVVATGKDAGRVTALRNGIATVRVYDRIRKLGTWKKHAIVVIVAGVLEDLEVLPNPFKVNAADTRNASVLGVLSSGLKTSNLRKLVEWIVDDPKLASVGNGEDDIGTVEGKAVGTTTLMARYDEFDIVSTAVDNLVVRGAVTSLAIEPESATVGLDLAYPLRAYANRDDGGRSNISSKARWSSDPAGAVLVDDAGVVTGVSNGVATVTAVDPATGFEDAIEVTVAGRLVSIEVSNVRVEKDDEKKAKATGRLSSGLETSDLRLMVNWSVANGTVARVGNGEDPDPGQRRLDPGEVLGLKLGTTTLTAVEPTTGLRSAQSGNLTVEPVDDGSDPDPDPDPNPNPDPRPNPGPTPVAPPGVQNVSVVVEPGNDGQVQTGQVVTYKARATRNDGSKKNISEKCDWTIADASVATVDDELPKKGGITGVAIGSTTVRIACDGLTAVGAVDVVGDVIGLSITPDSFTAAVGTEKQLRAEIHFSNGGAAFVTREIDWSSTNPDVATVENDNEAQKGRVMFHLPDEALRGEALIFGVDATGHVATSTVTVTR